MHAMGWSTILCTVAGVSGLSCDEATDCGSCLKISKSIWILTGCHWCELNQECHAVGSQVSPCAPSLADNDCVSTAKLSDCTKTTCNANAGMEARHIHLSLAGPTGMRVAWKTNARPSNSYVVFSSKETEDTVVKTDKTVQYMEGHGYHQVATLTGLIPGSTYQYQVVCDGVFSTLRSFRVAATDLSEASFLVLADFGYGYSDLGEVIATRNRIEKVKGLTDMTLHVGDIAYADNSFLHLPSGQTAQFAYEAAYDAWMEWMENITDSKPYMVSVGNHETECHSPACLASSKIGKALSNFTAYNARWAMPSQESGGVANMWYSFDYGPVHFVVANTETDFTDAPEGEKGGIFASGHFAPEGTYLKWLEQDLQKADLQRDDRPWVVVVGHRPWFYEGGQSIDEAVGKAHAKLLKKYSVDLYLSAHWHNYQRLLPINGNQETPTIIAGGNGNEEFSFDRKYTEGYLNVTATNDLWDYRSFNLDTTLGVMKVSETSLTFEAVASTTGEVIDVMTLTKDRTFHI